jgi:hypothetical protein
MVKALERSLAFNLSSVELAWRVKDGLTGKAHE